MRGSDYHLLILGGSTACPGGVEAFCDRSSEALSRRGNWRISRLPTDTAYLKLRNLPRFMLSLWALVRMRRAGRDCVWLQYGNLPDLMYLVVAKLLGLRVMVTPHLGSNWRSQSRPILRALSGRLLRLADRLALISMTQELEINLDRRIPRALIRNFLPETVLNLELNDSVPPPDMLQLIHSGRLSEGKGTFMVIDVCARLRDRGVPFHARITGNADPETLAQMNRMIDDYTLRDHVEILGRIPEEALLDHLRRSDVLVHLSRIDSYPLIVLEAIACSNLPVCMELAGARDQVETYGGHVVSVATPVEETVEWLATRDLTALRQEARAAASQVRSDYSWERCGGALDSALRACMSRDISTLSAQSNRIG